MTIAAHVEAHALVRSCGPDLAGRRDRALLLLGYAGVRDEEIMAHTRHLTAGRS